MSTRTALVTGANRGIGHEVARQLGARGLRVVAAARSDAAAVAEALRERDGIDAVGVTLDVDDATSVVQCAGVLRERGLAVDVLVNNAAILLDRSGVLEIPDEDIEATLRTNVLGPWRTAKAFLPGMIERGYGRVVNVSSGAGQISETDTYAPAYSVSKAALNMLTRKLAIEAAYAGGGDVKVNAVSPGWVRTDMGGASATRSVAEGAGTIVWLATLGPHGPTNGFFRDRIPVPW